MKGYNGTIFAYGQTGSGKTFTMQACARSRPWRGREVPLDTEREEADHAARTSWDRTDTTRVGQGPSIDDPEQRGIIPRIVDTIFQDIAAAPATIEFTVTVSYMEIYLERVRDLLERTDTGPPLPLRGARTYRPCANERLVVCGHGGPRQPATTTSAFTRTVCVACTSRACGRCT